jgi:uncharacterized protein (TIGR03086 family)
MSTIDQRYSRLAGAFADKIAAVRDDQWNSATPCEEWTVRDIVRHVVDSQGMFLGFVGDTAGDAPSVDEDPLGAFTTASGAVRARLADPERAGEEFDGMFGRTSFEHSVDRFLSTDLVVHGWDVAAATGQDTSIDPQEVDRVKTQVEEFGDKIRSPGAFGPAVEPPEGASDQDRLLAYLGRRA